MSGKEINKNISEILDDSKIDADKRLNLEMNELLADSVVLYQKLHHYHWEISGDKFFQLHELFENEYNYWKSVVDDVAERILTFGGKPLATLKQALELSSIKENPNTPSGKEMVSDLYNDYQAVLKKLASTIETAEELNNRGTANLLDGFSDTIEKKSWMLRSFLN